MQKVNIILGEHRRIGLEMTAADGAPFTIRNATWKLEKYGKEIEGGECEIEEHELIVMIQPAETGTHTLEYTFEIAEETLKERVQVVVE